MTFYRNIGRISVVVAAVVTVLLAQMGVSQGLPGIPICRGTPPTPLHHCGRAGECSPHDACAGKALGEIVEDSRTWCCKIVTLRGKQYCQQFTAYWRCCQGSGEPPRYFAVCKFVDQRMGENCDGQFCN